MKKKTQILLIHGGITFKNKKDYLRYPRKPNTLLSVMTCHNTMTSHSVTVKT